MAKEKARDLRADVSRLWGEQDRPTRGPKPSLSPQEIARAGVRLADAENLDAVSMSKVAAEFGVTAMALYRYVPGKVELVALMVESVLADRPKIPGSDADWRERITAWVRQCTNVYRAHPWLLAATATRRQGMGPCQLAWMDEAFAALDTARLPAPRKRQLIVLLLGLVRNLTQEVVDYDEEHDQEWNRLTGELLERHAARFPALIPAIAAGAFGPDESDQLEFGLACILDGVQALIDRNA